MHKNGGMASRQPASLTSDLNLYNFLRTINADAPAGSYSIVHLQGC